MVAYNTTIHTEAAKTRSVRAGGGGAAPAHPHPSALTHAAPHGGQAGATPHDKAAAAAHKGVQHGMPTPKAPAGGAKGAGPRTTMTDSKGGQYYVSSGGNKVYV